MFHFCHHFVIIVHSIACFLAPPPCCLCAGVCLRILMSDRAPVRSLLRRTHSPSSERSPLCCCCCCLPRQTVTALATCSLWTLCTHKHTPLTCSASGQTGDFLITFPEVFRCSNWVMIKKRSRSSKKSRSFCCFDTE